MKKNIKFSLVLLFVFVIFAGVIFVNAAVNLNNLLGFELSTSEVECGDKLYVNLTLNDKIKSDYDKNTVVLVYFEMEDGTEVFSAAVQEPLSDKPYLKVTSMFAQGRTYKISKIMVKSKNAVQFYSQNHLEGLAPNGGEIVRMNFNGKDVVNVKETVYVKDFGVFGDSEVDVDGEIKFHLELSNPVKSVSLKLQNKNVPTMSATVPVVELGDIKRVDLSQLYLYPGQYYVSDIYFQPTVSEKMVHYYSCIAMCNPDEYGSKLIKDAEFTIKGEVNEDQSKASEDDLDELKSISLLNNKAKLNEKVYVDLKTQAPFILANLTFTNDKGSITVDIKDINKKPYFIVPFTSEAGTYDLDYVIIKTKDGVEYHYRKGEDYYRIKHFDFNSQLIVENTVENGKLLSLDNEKIDDEIISKIKDLDSNIVIEINANNNYIIKQELFEAIQGVNKTIVIKYKDLEWTFNGLDIKNPKQIDVSSNIYATDLNESFTDKVKNGFVLDFANNKNLPGKCLIRLYCSEIVSKVMNKNKANVYYYNEDTEKFEIIKLATKYVENGGYYEFYIDHNSKYVITTDKIENKYIASTSAISSSNNFSNLAIIIVALLVVGTMVIIILKQQKQLQNLANK